MASHFGGRGVRTKRTAFMSVPRSQTKGDEDADSDNEKHKGGRDKEVNDDLNIDIDNTDIDINAGKKDENNDDTLMIIALGKIQNIITDEKLLKKINQNKTKQIGQQLAKVYEIIKGESLLDKNNNKKRTFSELGNDKDNEHDVPQKKQKIN